MMEQLGAGSFAIVNRAVADGIIKKGIMTTVAVKMLKRTSLFILELHLIQWRRILVTIGGTV